MTAGSRPAAGPHGRRFVVLPVAPHVVAALDAALIPVRAAVPDLRWTEPSGWHLTLAYVGELADDRVAALTDAMASAVTGTRAPRLQLTGAAVFGDTVLVADVGDLDGAAVTPALGDRVQAAIAARDVPVERRPLRAHVTLARGRSGELVDRLRAGTAVAIDVAAARVPLAWVPPAAEVWCSSGRSHGRGYAVDASVPFAA